jgi:hypothetical protein
MNAKQISANKKNSLKSTGPKSPAGKARSRLNPMKHGGYAKICIEGEDLRPLKALLLDLLAEFKPEGVEENLLVNEIAETRWRKNRFKIAEAKAISAYSYGNFGNGEEKGDVGFALAQDAGAYGTIPSCLAAEETLDRRLWRHFDRLRRIQKERGFCSWKANGAANLPPTKGLLSSEPHVLPASSTPVVFDGLPASSDCDYPQI